jgi:pimeloyl-ACP methyl ester carboxylesterase
MVGGDEPWRRGECTIMKKTMVAPPDNSSLYRSASGSQRVVAHYDATLQGMGIPYESVYVDTYFGPTHAIVSGHEQGKPLVLWHGLNANAATWANWIPALAPIYRVYAIDTIGGMGKSAPSRLAKGGPAYGQWAAEALEGLGLTRANMIGASNGGWLILKLGSVAPEMIGSAVLMSSAGFLSISMVTVLRMIPRSLFKPPEEVARGLLELLSPPDAPPDPFYLAFFELIVVSGFRSEQMAPALSKEEIGKLNAPTYLLMGQYEASFNPCKAIERGLALLPNVIAAEIVPGVGHAMVHRQTDWVIARVMSFLERHALQGHRPELDGRGSDLADRSSP